MFIEIKLCQISYDIDCEKQKAIKDQLEKVREITISLNFLGDTNVDALLETIDYDAYIKAVTGFPAKSYVTRYKFTSK